MPFKKTILILFCSALIFSACKKDIGIKPKPGAIEPYTCPFECTDTAQNYSQLPPEPFGGYFEATEYGKKSVWRVLPDPIDKDIIYYLTVEQGQPQHTLWKYNLVTKSKQYLTNNVLNNIEVHKNGWLVFDTFDWNIYKIKCNGDSLTKLTSNYNGLAPYWSYDGKFIYYDTQLGSQYCQVECNASGSIVDTFYLINERGRYYKDYMYYGIYDGTSSIVYQKNLITEVDKQILHSSTIAQDEQIGIFIPDENHEHLFWWGDHGLSKTNMNTLKTERLFSNTRSSRCWFAHFRQSPVTKRFFAVMFTVFAVNSTTIKQTGEIFEFSEDGKCRRKINIPN